MEAATAALEALTVAGGEAGVLPVNGSRGHSPLSLGGTSPVPGAGGVGGGAMPAAGGPVQMAGGPVPAAGGPVVQPNPENKLFVGGAPPGTDEETLKKIFEARRRPNLNPNLSTNPNPKPNPPTLRLPLTRRITAALATTPTLLHSGHCSPRRLTLTLTLTPAGPRPPSRNVCASPPPWP